MFARHLERLAAGGDHPEVRGGTKCLRDELRSRFENVLAVIENEQQVSLAQEGSQDLQRLHSGLVTEVNCREHGVEHDRRIANFGELDQPGPIPEPALEVGGGPQRQSGLPHTSWPDETDEPGGRELLPDLGQFATAAHEARRLSGQIA
jgi:hypothetical protein